MSKKDHQPHDKFIKQVLSDRKVVKQYIQQFVPKEIVENLDFRTLKSSPNSFVDEKLKEHISDIVYQCDWKLQKGKPHKVRISFLFEHKSYLPKYPHLQLLRYLLEAWENDVKEKKALTLTIPIVLYHGSKKWNYRPFSEYFELSSRILESFIPNFEYLLTDLSQMTDEEILNLEMGFLVNTFIILKHSRDKEYYKKYPDRIYIFGKEYAETESGLNFLQLIVFYILKTVKFEQEELNLYLEKLSNQVKDITMSTYDMLINQGVEKGREEGKKAIVKNMILKFPNYSDKAIADIAGISSDFVREVRQTMN